jgi:hypothetical protein
LIPFFGGFSTREMISHVSTSAIRGNRMAALHHS